MRGPPTLQRWRAQPAACSLERDSRRGSCLDRQLAGARLAAGRQERLQRAGAAAHLHAHGAGLHAAAASGARHQAGAGQACMAGTRGAGQEVELHLTRLLQQAGLARAAGGAAAAALLGTRNAAGGGSIGRPTCAGCQSAGRRAGGAPAPRVGRPSQAPTLGASQALHGDGCV